MKWIVSLSVIIAMSIGAGAQPSLESASRIVVDINDPVAVEQFLALSTPNTQARVTIDMGNPPAAEQFLLATNPIANPGERVVIHVNKNRASDEIKPLLAGGQAVPWETMQVVYSQTRRDSFLVFTSNTGTGSAPTGASVSVALPTASGWSEKPIQFGLNDSLTNCPLDKGYSLDVATTGEGSPQVRLNEPGPDLYSGRH
jgi:hypothetical protein